MFDVKNSELIVAYENALEMGLDKRIIDLFESELSNRSIASSAFDHYRTKKNHRVLIVDDSRFVRTYLKQIFQEMKVEFITEASNGKEAVQLFKREQPDLVIMDIAMPKMNGIEALKEILNWNKGANVIMCSTSNQKNTIIGAVVAGAKDFITKPFMKENVQQVAARFLLT